MPDSRQQTAAGWSPSPTLLELPGVTDARSNIAIRTIKEAGELPLPTPWSPTDAG